MSANKNRLERLVLEVKRKQKRRQSEEFGKTFPEDTDFRPRIPSPKQASASNSSLRNSEGNQLSAADATCSINDSVVTKEGLCIPVPEKYFCDTCDANFSEWECLKDHAQTHFNEISQKSGIYGKMNKNRRSLKKQSPSVETEKLKCGYCESTFTHKSSLLRHIFAHTGEKPYKCDVCAAAFSKKDNLQRHSLVHTGEKLFQCDVCGGKYGEKSSLVKHHRIHTGEKPYVCKECGYKFAYSSHLRRHERTHTGEQPHTCLVCGVSFALPFSLRAHARMHINEKPHNCEFCGATFRERRYLQKHMGVHIGNGMKPFICNDCGDGFMEKCELKRHLRVHDGEKTLQVCVL